MAQASITPIWLRRGGLALTPPGFLLDEHLPKALARSLRQAGLDVDMVKDRLRGHPDEDIWQLAVQEGRCILTRDAGFVRRALDGSSVVGVVLFRLRARPELEITTAPDMVRYVRQLPGAVLRFELR